MKYIDNKQELGIDYDWVLIKKRFKKLKIPDDVYNPCKIDLASFKYFINLSDRSAGKTTNWLLLGMTMNVLYGTQIQYVRQRSENITPKNTKDLFSTILTYDYVSKLTDGKYNSVTYKARRWYYCHVDDNGNVDEIANEHFMFMCSVDKGEDLKSSYNAPLGDIIIFDEFLSTYYYENEFVWFCDLVKTIIRERQSPIIVMLANTIDKHSQYFNELEIYEQVQTLAQGDNVAVTTKQGTRLYIEILGKTRNKALKRSVINKLFFGFKNPQLASITGADWQIKNYQHIPKDEVDVIYSNIYIYHNDRYIRLDIVNNERLGTCIYVHWATKIYDDSIILTVQERTDPRYQYKFGTGRLNQLIGRAISQNRLYYATNDVGSFFDNYLKYCSKIA